MCPVCNKVSVTFDPFMYLSLPLPSTTMRMMTLMVFSTDGGAQPSPYTITVPKNGKCKDMIEALSVACNLGTGESLLVAEVCCNKLCCHYCMHVFHATRIKHCFFFFWC